MGSEGNVAHCMGGCDGAIAASAAAAAAERGGHGWMVTLIDSRNSVSASLSPRTTRVIFRLSHNPA